MAGYEYSLLENTDFWIGLSFLIFVAILWHKARGAVVNMIDAKIDRIKKEIQTAEDLRIEAQELLAQYQRKHKDAIKEAENIILSAEKRVTEIRKHADIEISDMISLREKQLQDRLRRMEETAIQDIKKYAADLTINATARIIQDHMDKKTNEKLIKDTTSKIVQSFH